MPTIVTCTRHNSKEYLYEYIGQKSDHKMIRLDIEGNSEVGKIIRNPHRVGWDSYQKHQSNNMVHLEVNAYISCELQLEIVVETSRLYKPIAKDISSLTKEGNEQHSSCHPNRQKANWGMLGSQSKMGIGKPTKSNIAHKGSPQGCWVYLNDQHFERHLLTFSARLFIEC